MTCLSKKLLNYKSRKKLFEILKVCNTGSDCYSFRK